MKAKNSVLIIILAVILAITGGSLLINDNQKSSESSVSQTSNTSGSESQMNTQNNDTISPQLMSAKDQLLYLIEEEKLAHDVYTVMYQKYGARVFANILKSETTHQNRVLALLQARNIDDPRSDQIGVFVDPQLQTLYDSLIAQGNKSLSDAIDVGVAIEEKDIRDITEQLAVTTDQDIIDTLGALRSASESHLRAFKNQQ